MAYVEGIGKSVVRAKKKRKNAPAPSRDHRKRNRGAVGSATSSEAFSKGKVDRKNESLNWQSTEELASAVSARLGCGDRKGLFSKRGR